MNKHLFRSQLTAGVLIAMCLGTANTTAQAGYVEDRDAAVKLYWQDKTPEALAAFVKLADESTLDLQKAEALDWASKAAIRLRDYDKAKELAAAIPLEPMSLTAQARVLVREGRWQEVIDALGEHDLSIWRPSAAAEAYLLRAMAYERLEKPANAIGDYTQAVEMAQEHNARANALLGLGRVYLADGKPEEGIKAWQRVLTESSNTARHSDAVMAIARVLAGQEKYAEALAALNKVDGSKVTVKSLQIELLIAKAAIHAKQGEKAQAIKLYQQAIDTPGIAASRKQLAQDALKALEN